jgi:hypothetical protein
MSLVCCCRESFIERYSPAIVFIWKYKGGRISNQNSFSGTYKIWQKFVRARCKNVSLTM